MFPFLKKSNEARLLPFVADVHSHLLPGLDDGVKSVEESMYIIGALKSLGYRKVVTTPHIMTDQYPNSEEDIVVKLAEMNRILQKDKHSIELEAAAEYFLDEHLLSSLAAGKKLLTFGPNYLLFETFMNQKPAFLEEAVFDMNSNGYLPVLAHPERYGYLHGNEKLIQQLKRMNVLFQINLGSLLGYYSSSVRRSALQMLKTGVVDFVGSDCHNALQMDELLRGVRKRNNSFLFDLSMRNAALAH
jgi:protein-tyrosine phosphatase